MAKNIIGIDISDSSIEALALEKSHGNFVVESYSRFRLSPDIIEKGRIVNRDKLKEAILKMFKNAKPLPFDLSRKVFLSLPESQTFSKILSIPKNIKSKDLETAVLNKAEEVVPESLDKLISVIRSLPETANEKPVFYVGAQIEVVREFVDLFKELNIEVVGITTETVSSFYGLKRDKDKKNTLLLDLGSQTTITSVFSENSIYASINIGIGGENITEAISKKLNIPHSQAEKKKVKNGLTSTESGEIMLISQGQLQPLVDEIKIFIQYWQKSTGHNIDQVVLIGGLSQMKDADKYFGDNLNLPTKIGEPFIDKNSLPAKLEFVKYINVLGLARLAQEGTDIDFYKKIPKESLKKTETILSANVKPNIFKRFLALLNFKNFIVLFKNRYFLIVLALLLLGDGVYVFRDKILPPTTPLSIEETIIVSSDKTKLVENFIAGEYFDLVASKIYNSSTDADLPDDYIDNFDNALSRAKATLKIDKAEAIINDYGPDGFYVLPKVVSYDVVGTDPEKNDYKVAQELKVHIKYVFVMISEEAVRGLLVANHPELANNINTLAYKIIEYSQDEQAENFKVLVSVNKNQ